MKNGKNGSEFAADDRRYKLVLAALLLTGRRQLGKMRCRNSFVYYVFQPVFRWDFMSKILAYFLAHNL